MGSERQADSAVLFYEGRSGTYDYTWHPSFAQRFSSSLDISPGQHVLDLACGTGLLTFLEANRVGPTGRVVGVDITPGMLSGAQAKKQAAGDKFAQVELYQGDILNLDTIEGVKGQTFDLITLASALVLLPDPHAAVQYWTGYLKPGGIIAMDSTHPRNLVSGIILERTARRLGLPVPYNRTWSESENSLKEVLESAGLEVEKVITVENQAGFGRRLHDQAMWEDHFVEKIIMGDTLRTFADPAIRRKAHGVFKEEWDKLAESGRVEEVDTVFLGIARKPLSGSTARPKSETIFTGACRCGNIKFSSTARPSDFTFCHCRSCQQLSGSAFLGFASVPRDALKFSASSTRQSIRLSDVAERTFCSGCGAPLTMAYTFEPDIIWIVVSLIEPGSLKGGPLKVKSHIYLREKAEWFTVPDDGGERFESSFFDHLIKPIS
ncbi:S-adenosyl-L-methionine-dependent methyltransferase [Lophiostoma macrostomum CBS 122681]|uniref:S-adenosyl-L-methionine-dependent methyltransferase n=1 Tax=Lophiostoma macrostomum CBS 122681 TaxID=1314788 RepID=A0A6A6TCT9_9PLEO|nr:S-adenosyl-L-methionine-dependent methyltransferase [Lophiostoma macrostomum CBS 122681]